MLELKSRGLFASRAEREWRVRMQAGGCRIPDGVTANALYRAAGGWMRDELAYLFRREEKEPIDHLISAEYLPGRLFEETAREFGVWDAVESAAEQFGYTGEQIADREKEMCLGNGAPGKCAMQIVKKGWRGLRTGGYGLCYTEGWFRQRILDGEQVELPERWLEKHPMIVANEKEGVKVTFGGTVEERFSESGMQVFYRNAETVRAIPYDVWLPREEGKAATRLRLWRASPDGFSFSPEHSQEDYLRQMQERKRQSAITDKLYPSDVSEEGRMLRLYQSYFLVSASLQDIRRRESKGGEEICLNGAFAALAIPEWMRLCMDEDGMGWDAACREVRRRFCAVTYERSEELEIDGARLKLVLPRIHAILAELARRDPTRGLWRNGVFDLGVLLEMTLEKERFFPCGQFFGLSPATWARFGNGAFSFWADRHLGDGWRKDPSLFRKARYLAEGACGELAAEKEKCKKRLVSFLRARQERFPDPGKHWFVLTGSITGRHRILLSLLRMLYYRERLRGGENVPSLCLILGGKAAPGDAFGKELLRLAWHLGWELREDPVCRELLEIVIVENYNARAAELLLPAADVFEHLTLPGMGELGTDACGALSCGGFLLSTRGKKACRLAKAAGGVTLFGMSEEALDTSWREGYRALHHIRTDPTLRAVTSQLGHRIHGEEFSLLSDHLTRLGGRVADPYFCLADMASYLSATDAVACLLSKEKGRSEMLLSVSGLAEWMQGYA